jgi:hypothetical protein
MRPVDRNGRRVKRPGEGYEKEETPGDRRRMLPDANALQSLNSVERGQPLAEDGFSGPVSDPSLARLIDAWPVLPDQIKAAILALVVTAR